MYMKIHHMNKFVKMSYLYRLYKFKIKNYGLFLLLVWFIPRILFASYEGVNNHVSSRNEALKIVMIGPNYLSVKQV